MRYFNIFFEMMITEMLFLSKLEKRRYFWIKTPIEIVLFGAASYFAGYIPEIFGQMWFRSIIPLVFGVLFVVVSYKLPPLKSVCFGIVAYSVQHTSYIIHTVVFMGRPLGQPWMTITDYTFFLVVLFLFWFIFVRKSRIQAVVDMENAKLSVICLFVLILTYALDYFFNDENYYETIARVFMAISIVLSLELLFNLSQRDSLKREKAEIEHILKQEERLHRISKDNIDMLNMKCHDLKHHLEVFRACGAVQSDAVKELEATVAQYDGFLKTGNGDLDIVIAEKNFRCKEKDITLSCIIDGKLFDFMSSGDIYSLFGNALDNAIEYLEKVEDKRKRIVDLTAQTKGNFIAVQIENFCDETLKFEDGLPVTVKKDKNYHGFGMKSMRYIIEKYGGVLHCERRDQMFVLNIIFPVAKN